MKSRVATRLAWSLCALSLVLTVLSILLLSLNYFHPRTHDYGYGPENILLPICFSIIGAILASRLPTNPLGWLFCAAVSVSAVAHFSGEYAIYALLAQPQRLPAGEALACLTAWVWVSFIGFMVISLLLFPDGHLPGRRWAWLVWFTVLLTSVGSLWQAFSPGLIDSLGTIRNPLGAQARSCTLGYGLR
jgi:hypothetical protein